MYFYYLSSLITSEINSDTSKPCTRLRYAPSASNIEITASIFVAFCDLSGLQLSLWSDLMRTLEKHHLTKSDTSMMTLPLSNNLSNSFVGRLKLPSDCENGYIGSPALVAEIANCVEFQLS